MEGYVFGIESWDDVRMDRVDGFSCGLGHGVDRKLQYCERWLSYDNARTGVVVRVEDCRMDKLWVEGFDRSVERLHEDRGLADIYTDGPELRSSEGLYISYRTLNVDGDTRTHILTLLPTPSPHVTYIQILCALSK